MTPREKEVFGEVKSRWAGMRLDQGSVFSQPVLDMAFMTSVIERQEEILGRYESLVPENMKLAQFKLETERYLDGATPAQAAWFISTVMGYINARWPLINQDDGVVDFTEVGQHLHDCLRELHGYVVTAKRFNGDNWLNRLLTHRM